MESIAIRGMCGDEYRAGPTGRHGVVNTLSQGYVRAADFTLGYFRSLPMGESRGW
jgi:hypothetical protein